MPDSLDVLRTLGIDIPLDEAAVIRGIRFIEGSFSLETHFASGTGIAIRRPVLHRHLIKHASRLGVEMIGQARRIQFNSGQLQIAASNG